MLSTAASTHVLCVAGTWQFAGRQRLKDHPSTCMARTGQFAGSKPKELPMAHLEVWGDRANAAGKVLDLVGLHIIPVALAGCSRAERS